VINRLAAENQKESVWRFLAGYVHPRSEYGLDRRHLEENDYNRRSNVFIRGCGRVPDDPDYEAGGARLFECARAEPPYRTPAFDDLLETVCRVLMNRDAALDRECEAYRALCGSEVGMSAGAMAHG